MFTFSVTEVRAVIMRGRIDAFNNGGFRNPYYGLRPGKSEKPICTPIMAPATVGTMDKASNI